MSFVFYDTETTGVNTQFDQILQFAAIYTDDELNAQDEINLRCRIQPHVVPSPGALLATGITIGQLEGAELSHYEMVAQIRTWLESKSPSCFIGYNSIRFDETLLRQAFYQSLLPAYLTNTQGNFRADVMIVAQAAAIHAPESITVPTGNRGRAIFRLGDIARANGVQFSEEEAHEALADVRATIAVARHIRENAPDVWNRMLANAQKEQVLGFVEENDIISFSSYYFGNPFSFIVTPAATNAENPNELALFDLANSPEQYFALDVQSLVGVLNASPKVIRTVRANAQPTLMPFDLAPDEIRGPRLDEATYRERARLIRENSGFRESLSQAMPMRYPEKVPSPYVEAQIYDAFPSPADGVLMEQFHQAPWAERLGICARLADTRVAELGRRLVFLEQPEELPELERAEYVEWVTQRLTTEEDVPWLTISKALQEVDDLGGRRTEDGAQLQEIREHLLTMANRVG